MDPLLSLMSSQHQRDSRRSQGWGQTWVQLSSEWDRAQDPRTEWAADPCYFDSNIEYVF